METTIYDVAKKAGVSVATVSRAINNRRGPSENTSQIVKQAVKDLGYKLRDPIYRPGPKINGYNGLRTGTVILASSQECSIALKSPIYSQIISGIERELSRRNLHLVISVIRDFSDVRSFFSDNVEGVILFSPLVSKFPKSVANLFGKSNVISILGEPLPWCDHVTYNNRIVGVLAARYFLDLHLKNVAYIGPSTAIFVERAAAFKKQIEEEGGRALIFNDENLAPPALSASAFNHESFDNLIEKALSTTPSLAGLFVPADMFVAPLYSALYRRGILPTEISVVSVNKELALLGQAKPFPATVDIMGSEIGVAAVRHLIASKGCHYEDTSRNRVTVMLDPVIVSPQELEQLF